MKKIYVMPQLEFVRIEFDHPMMTITPHSINEYGGNNSGDLGGNDDGGEDLDSYIDDLYFF